MAQICDIPAKWQDGSQKTLSFWNSPLWEIYAGEYAEQREVVEKSCFLWCMWSSRRHKSAQVRHKSRPFWHSGHLAQRRFVSPLPEKKALSISPIDKISWQHLSLMGASNATTSKKLAPFLYIVLHWITAVLCESWCLKYCLSYRVTCKRKRNLFWEENIMSSLPNHKFCSLKHH